MAQFFLQPNGPRPDFRLVITFLWGDFHDADTDGDSHNPASREWTSLYCQNREQKTEVFNVLPVGHDPLTLEVRSEQAELAGRVAYFLAVETNSLVATDLSGQWHNPDWLRDQVGSFDIPEAEQRTSASCWRRSTLENPYPNLTDSPSAI